MCSETWGWYAQVVRLKMAVWIPWPMHMLTDAFFMALYGHNPDPWFCSHLSSCSETQQLVNLEPC